MTQVRLVVGHCTVLPSKLERKHYYYFVARAPLISSLKIWSQILGTNCQLLYRVHMLSPPPMHPIHPYIPIGT